MLGVALAALVALLAPTGAAAQGTNSLQSITPEDGAILDASPEVITLVFNQELADDDRIVLGLSCSNQPQATGLPAVDADGLIVTVGLTAPVPRGNCFISWSLSNGANEIVLQQTSSFNVTTDPPVASTDGSSSTTSPFVTVPAVSPAAPSAEVENPGSTGGAIWLGRLLSTMGILIVFGSLALISVGWPEGPEYVVTVRFLRSVWVMALIGTLLYIVAFSADAGGLSFGGGTSPGAWLDLFDAGWSGRGALIRFAAVIAMGWVAMRPERIIDPASAMWAWAIPGLALIGIALTRASDPLAFIVNFAHAAAAGVWFGGVVLVARIVLRGPGDDDLIQATRTFSRFSLPAMLVVTVTGIIQMLRLDGGELFSSGHGRVLVLKVIAVVVMLAVAFAVRQQVTLRLDRMHELNAATADRFKRAFHAEAAVGVVVLGLSGWLLAFTPPTTDPLAGETYMMPIPINDAETGLDARVFLGPGRAGPTGFKVEINGPVEGLTSFKLRFIPPLNDVEAPIIEQSIPLTTAVLGTYYLDDSDGLPLNLPGTWTIQVFASTASGATLDGATGSFPLVDQTGVVPTIPPVVVTTPVEVQIIDSSTTVAPFATSPTVPPSESTTPTTAPPG
jgi:copper transport protein